MIDIPNVKYIYTNFHIFELKIRKHRIIYLNKWRCRTKDTFDALYQYHTHTCKINPCTMWRKVLKANVLSKNTINSTQSKYFQKLVTFFFFKKIFRSRQNFEKHNEFYFLKVDSHSKDPRKLRGNGYCRTSGRRC